LFILVALCDKWVLLCDNCCVCWCDDAITQYYYTFISHDYYVIVSTTTISSIFYQSLHRNLTLIIISCYYYYYYCYYYYHYYYFIFARISVSPVFYNYLRNSLRWQDKCVSVYACVCAWLCARVIGFCSPEAVLAVAVARLLMRAFVRLNSFYNLMVSFLAWPSLLLLSSIIIIVIIITIIIINIIIHSIIITIIILIYSSYYYYLLLLLSLFLTLKYTDIYMFICKFYYYVSGLTIGLNWAFRLRQRYRSFCNGGTAIGSLAVDTFYLNSSHLITVCWVLQSVHPLSIPLWIQAIW
jgi:hypothetical protein